MGGLRKLTVLNIKWDLLQRESTSNLLSETVRSRRQLRVMRLINWGSVRLLIIFNSKCPASLNRQISVKKPGNSVAVRNEDNFFLIHKMYAPRQKWFRG